jgi:hypothetical protein
VIAVLLAKAFREQEFDRLTEQLCPLIAEQALRLTVDEHDLPIPIHDHNTIGRGLQQGLNLPLHHRLADVGLVQSKRWPSSSARIFTNTAT